MKKLIAINKFKPIRGKSQGIQRQFFFLTLFCAAAFIFNIYIWALLLSFKNCSLSAAPTVNPGLKTSELKSVRLKTELWQERKRASELRAKGHFYTASPVEEHISESGEEIGVSNLIEGKTETVINNKIEPPSVRISAISEFDGNFCAMLEISCEKCAVPVRPGFIFGGGKGRITAVDLKGVSWLWMGKKQRTEI